MSIKPRAMRDVLLEQIWNAMGKDETIFFVSADFGAPVLDKIRTDFPSRFVNVGIAEQNLINITAGLALEGYTVFAYAIAPFITMRCFEQIRVNLALLSEVRPMNVNLIGVGAGYSYVVSGPTHQCYEDLTLVRALPNFQILSPADHVTTENLFSYCMANHRPKYLRFDAQILPPIYEDRALDVMLGFNVHKTGESICLIATGYMLHTALQVADELNASGENVGVIDLFNLTDFSDEMLEEAIKSYKGIVSMEEGFSGRGGLDAMLNEFFAVRQIDCQLLSIGVKPGYRFDLGTRENLHEHVGIGRNAVLDKVKQFITLLPR